MVSRALVVAVLALALVATAVSVHRTTAQAADAVLLEAPSHIHLAYRPGVPLVNEVLVAGAPA